MSKIRSLKSSKGIKNFDFFKACMVFILKYFVSICRAVIFRLGRVLEGDEKGPGIFFV